MDDQPGIFVIVEPRASELTIVQLESQRFDEMKLGTGVGGEADDVAGIRWDIGMNQYYGEHLRCLNAPYGGMSSRLSGVRLRAAASAPRPSSRPVRLRDL